MAVPSPLLTQVHVIMAARRIEASPLVTTAVLRSETGTSMMGALPTLRRAIARRDDRTTAPDVASGPSEKSDERHPSRRASVPERRSKTFGKVSRNAGRGGVE